ncbi:MAG: glycosyltransferase family 4 protein [Caulobacterales bacterium]|nr:glycosyltransferase family 4 protein [Caulobacterales bacterium]
MVVLRHKVAPKSASLTNLNALFSKTVIKHRFSRNGRNPDNDRALQEGHILTVLQVTPELNAGGVERTTLEMAEAISRAGGLALVASAGGRLEPDLEAVGGELIKLAANSKNPIAAVANACALARIVRERGVQIVHARSRAPAWSAYAAARITNTPFVTTYHGIYNARSGPKRFYNSVMAKGDLIIANSEYTRAHILAEHGVAPERVVTIPRGVDLDIFDPAKVRAEDVAAMRTAWGRRDGDERVAMLMPARLTRWKGHLELIDALKLVEARKPGVLKVIIAGDAQGRHAYEQDIVTRIEGAKLQDVVAIVGHVGQMPVAFAASDLAVFPVIEPEAFGRGAVEAQAMGVPVIASKLGGFAETIVEGETGALVPAGDVTALADAIVRFIELGPEARARMGQRGRERVRGLYSKNALQTATLAVYQQLLRAAEEQNRLKVQHKSAS